MDTTLFQKLANSLKQAAAISRGEMQPGKAFSKKIQNNPDAIKNTLRTIRKSTPNKVSIKSLSLPKNAKSDANIDARLVREKTGLSQSQFALVMNVSVKTLQNWEQHRREPTGPAASLLKIVSKAPEVALEALHS